MTDNYRIIISSKGKSFEISRTSGAHLTEGGLKGFDSPSFDVSVCPYAAQHGGYIQKRRFSERELSITFEIERPLSDTLRRSLVSMLDPTEDCVIDMEIGSIHRKITAALCDEPVFSHPTFADPTEVTLYFIAPSVFFTAENDTAYRLRDKKSLFTFPLTFMSSAGMTPGIFISNGTAVINNPGDSECGAVITMTATGGDIVNPKISLGNEYILCLLTVHDGDELIIDTRARMRNILLNGERCFSFDKNSKFFSLPVGESPVTMSCDSGMEYSETVVSFTPVYYGV